MNHEDDEEGIDDRRSVTGKPNDHIVQANEKEMIVSNGQMSDNKPIEVWIYLLFEKGFKFLHGEGFWIVFPTCLY